MDIVRIALRLGGKHEHIHCHRGWLDGVPGHHAPLLTIYPHLLHIISTVFMLVLASAQTDQALSLLVLTTDVHKTPDGADGECRLPKRQATPVNTGRVLGHPSRKPA